MHKLRWKRRHYVVTNTEVCSRFSSLEIDAIKLKLLHIMQNDLKSQSITFFGNLPSGHKITALRNEIAHEPPPGEWI